MTTFELTWQQDHNRVPSQTSVLDQSRYVQWWLKAFLKGELGGATQGLWTCEGSSDSTAAGMDGNDRWGSTYNGAKIVRANGAVAHSWLTLKSPVGLGPWYMCIDFNTVNDYDIDLFFSKSPFTGGSTTARPTATNEWGYTDLTIVQTTGPVNAHMFSRLSTTGEFWIVVGRDGALDYGTVLAFFTLDRNHPADVHNGWSCAGFSNSTQLLRAGAGSVGSGNTFIKGRNFDASVAVAGYFILPCINASAASVMTDIPTTDATDGAYNDFPCYLAVSTASHKSIRGRVRDVLWAPFSAPQNTVEPASGPPYQSQVCGNLWLPYNASTAPSL